MRLKKQLILVALLAVLVGFNYVVISMSEISRTSSDKMHMFMLNPFAEKLISLEYEGLRAFQLSLSERVAIGAILEKYKYLPPSVADFLLKSNSVITSLNPYYYEVYYYTSMLLMWDFKRPRDALFILKKALHYIKDKPSLYLFAGFDYFYFLHDSINGAHYITMAAEKEKHAGNKILYYTVAAKLLSTTGRTKIAIMMLDNYIKNTKEEKVRLHLVKKREELLLELKIQEAIKMYKRLYGKVPEDVKELKKSGLYKGPIKSPRGFYFCIEHEDVVLKLKCNENIGEKNGRGR